MINLKNYICALKSTWIRRLLANDSNMYPFLNQNILKLRI